MGKGDSREAHGPSWGRLLYDYLHPRWPHWWRPGFAPGRGASQGATEYKSLRVSLTETSKNKQGWENRARQGGLAGGGLVEEIVSFMLVKGSALGEKGKSVRTTPEMG